MFKINHIPAQKILHLENYVKGKQDTFKCKYWTVIGKMNYIAMGTRPDIIFEVYPCAKYCNNPNIMQYKLVQ